MKEDEDKGHRAFYHFNESWYASAARTSGRVVDEVTFGIYHEEGGTSGEMSMRWHDIASGRPPAPRLECFDDAFAVLAGMPDLIAALAEHDGENMAPSDFCLLLVKLGFKDETKREAPGEETRGEERELRRVVKGIDFDHMNVRTLRRVIEAVSP